MPVVFRLMFKTTGAPRLAEPEEIPSVTPCPRQATEAARLNTRMRDAWDFRRPVVAKTEDWSLAKVLRFLNLRS